MNSENTKNLIAMAGLLKNMMVWNIWRRRTKNFMEKVVMNSENTKNLIASCPKIFRLKHNPEPGPAHPFQLFGFECGDGWYNIIKEASDKIEELVSKLPEDSQSDFYVCQIKEKFGTLRYYMSYETEEISEIIQEAEKKSAETCEVCGEKGGLTVSRNWFSTVCETHKKEDSKDAIQTT